MDNYTPLNNNICKQIDERLQKLYTMNKDELKYRLFHDKNDESLIHELFSNFHN